MIVTALTVANLLRIFREQGEIESSEGDANSQESLRVALAFKEFEEADFNYTWNGVNLFNALGDAHLSSLFFPSFCFFFFFRFFCF